MVIITLTLKCLLARGLVRFARLSDTMFGLTSLPEGLSTITNNNRHISKCVIASNTVQVELLIRTNKVCTAHFHGNRRRRRSIEKNTYTIKER